jgi:hypothetical protein
MGAEQVSEHLKFSFYNFVYLIECLFVCFFLKAKTRYDLNNIKRNMENLKAMRERLLK